MTCKNEKGKVNITKQLKKTSEYNWRINVISKDFDTFGINKKGSWVIQFSLFDKGSINYLQSHFVCEIAQIQFMYHVNPSVKNSEFGGLPWCPVVKTSVLPLQGAQVQSLVRELRSCMPHSRAKKRKENLVKNGEFYS